MTLIDSRYTYRPFEYPQAYDYFETQQQAHWLWSEVGLTADILDWNTNLNEQEKNIIAGVLKGFTTTETIVCDYWSQRVARWFPKPEIVSMAVTFAAWEAIHQRAYNNLIESIGLEEYDPFEQDSEVADRLEHLINTPQENIADIACSLAVFSGFCEGVCLYSAFAILKYFPFNNKLKGVGKIIDWSVRDERLHSQAGCWLFRELIKEMPSIDPNFDYIDLENKVREAADNVIKLETSFIDSVFKGSTLEGLNPNDLKEYIKFCADLKLKELGYTSHIVWDASKSSKVSSWFDVAVKGQKQQDFFAGAVADYTKGSLLIDGAELDFDF